MAGVPGFEDEDETESSEGSAAAEARPAKKAHWGRRILAVVAALVVVSLVAGLIYAFSIQRSLTANLNRSDNSMPQDTPTGAGESPRPTKPTTGAGSGALNYVLMGSDSRDVSDSGAGRSDVLMVVHLDADRKHAYVVSFPRDMWVSIPGHGKAKINAAFAYGGPSLTIRTLEGMLGTRMDHLALIDFEGFIDLTNALGGVTIDNKYYSKGHGYEFPVGKITIKGEQALWYVRERHQLPNGDLDRAQRQRIVVQAIMKKGLSGDTISNPVKFTSFVSQLAKSVTVDSSLSNSEIRKTALSLRLTGGDITLLQAPISGFGTIDGQSVDVVDETKLDALAKALRGDDMASYVKKYPDS